MSINLDSALPVLENFEHHLDILEVVHKYFDGIYHVHDMFV